MATVIDFPAPSIPLDTVSALDAAWNDYRDLRMLEHGDRALADCPRHQAALSRAFAAYMRIFDGWASR